MGVIFDCPRIHTLLHSRSWTQARVSLQCPLPQEGTGGVAADNSGVYPSGQRGQTVNLLAYAFRGSNPLTPISEDGGPLSFDGVVISPTRGRCPGLFRGLRLTSGLACHGVGEVDARASKLGPRFPSILSSLRLRCRLREQRHPGRHGR